MLENNGVCPQCNKGEVYSATLTRGLCFTCHSINERDWIEMAVEVENVMLQEVIG